MSPSMFANWRTAILHPSVRTMPEVATRQSAFMLAHLAGAAIIGASLAAYIAVTGAPGLKELSVLAWLLAPLAIAGLLRASGDLNLVQSLWLVNLALFITFLAAVTGGITSFVTVWLLVVPAEAALSGKKRLIHLAGILCLLSVACLLALAQLQWLPAPWFSPSAGPELQAIGTIGAILYASLVALSVQKAHRKIEQAAKSSEAAYKHLASNVSDMISRHSRDGTMTFVSPAAQTLLGIRANELTGRGLADLAHPDDVVDVAGALARTGFFGGDSAVEYRIRRADGHYIWVESRCRPVISLEAAKLAPTPRGLPAPHCFDVICVTRDVSERKAYEQALIATRDAAEASSQAKTRFLAGMSHELRTPLNAVIGFAEMIRTQMMGPVGSEKYREYAGLIVDSGEHLLNLINDVLDLSKVEAGKANLELESLSVAALVDETMQLVQLASQKAGVSVLTDFRTRLPAIQADRRAVKQILLNLLSNAIKFTPEGGQVTISAQADLDRLTLKVEDNGIGMSTQTLERVGRPFERSDDALTKAKQGTGLGLALVRAMADLHHGDVKIESREGDGTSVTVWLPLRQPQSAAKDLSLSVDQAVDSEDDSQVEVLPLKGAA